MLPYFMPQQDLICIQLNDLWSPVQNEMKHSLFKIY